MYEEFENKVDRLVLKSTFQAHEDYLNMHMATKAAVTAEISEVQKDLDTYKFYVGKNFMSATE